MRGSGVRVPPAAPFQLLVPTSASAERARLGASRSPPACVIPAQSCQADLVPEDSGTATWSRLFRPTGAEGLRMTFPRRIARAGEVRFGDRKGRGTILGRPKGPKSDQIAPTVIGLFEGRRILTSDREAAADRQTPVFQSCSGLRLGEATAPQPLPLRECSSSADPLSFRRYRSSDRAGRAMISGRCS